MTASTLLREILPDAVLGLEAFANEGRQFEAMSRSCASVFVLRAGRLSRVDWRHGASVSVYALIGFRAGLRGGLGPFRQSAKPRIFHLGKQWQHPGLLLRREIPQQRAHLLAVRG